MKALIKRVLKDDRTQRMAAYLLASYIKLVYITSRKTYHVDELAKPYIQGKENAIFAFWHGRMMMCPTFEPPGRKMHVLISSHRDGKLISRVISHFGESTVSGSSSKGGAMAVKELLRLLQKGDNISITPDGPRGPFQEADKGVAMLSRLSRKPVIPVTFSASRHKRLGSWDRFMLALPFGHIVFCADAPIEVSDNTASADMEQKRKDIETSMNTLVEKADRLAHA